MFLAVTRLIFIVEFNLAEYVRLPLSLLSMVSKTSPGVSPISGEQFLITICSNASLEPQGPCRLRTIDPSLLWAIDLKRIADLTSTGLVN